MVRFAQLFLEDRQGAVAITIALMSVALIGFIALGVDFARSYAVKSRLGYAIDAAALYGGSNIASPTVEADMRKIFDANFPNDYLGSYDVQFNPTVDVNNDTIIVAVDASIPTTLGRVMGMDKIDIGTKNEAKRAVSGVELAMVLDVTGSMDSQGRIPAMKAAATELINILYGSEETVQNFWVSLVPYVVAVNVGNQHTDWVTGLNQADYAPTTWKGCVNSRIGLDTTDAPPSTQLFTPFLNSSTLNLYPDTGDNDWPQGGAVHEEHYHGGTDAYGPNRTCATPITPLTAEKSTIQAGVDALEAWPSGTAINVGLVWGWRTISPNWRGLWGGSTPVNLPMDYNEPFMNKVAIVLTDGQMNWNDWNNKRPDFSPDGYGDQTSYGRSLPAGFGSTELSAEDELRSRLATICSSMKAQGIIIYSITFKAPASAKPPMQACASSLNHYFDSPSNSDLITTFQQIGSELSSLRLSQ